jgi:hypothetical protein
MLFNSTQINIARTSGADTEHGFLGGLTYGWKILKKKNATGENCACLKIGPASCSCDKNCY